MRKVKDIFRKLRSVFRRVDFNTICGMGTLAIVIILVAVGMMFITTFLINGSVVVGRDLDKKYIDADVSEFELGEIDGNIIRIIDYETNGVCYYRKSGGNISCFRMDGDQGVFQITR